MHGLARYSEALISWPRRSIEREGEPSG